MQVRLVQSRGSPPCVRGRVVSVHSLPLHIRYTPVRTVKRAWVLAVMVLAAVHPRAYGEEQVPDVGDGWRDGSPPCVRGRVEPRGARFLRQRFTPVRTGKRPAPGDASLRSPVHPRAYGEEGNAGGGGFADERFTPVRTGKSRAMPPLAYRVPVHPRAYGEEANGFDLSHPPHGSPPCVRGRGGTHRLHGAVHRFTPVRTGKSCATATPTRGNYGSPPCVRGRVQPGQCRPRPERFTPVRTGKRPHSCRSRSAMPVHPRAYGEEQPRPRVSTQGGGSPPCVRGRAHRHMCRADCRRFTPVRTGKRDAREEGVDL